MSGLMAQHVGQDLAVKVATGPTPAPSTATLLRSPALPVIPAIPAAGSLTGRRLCI